MVVNDYQDPKNNRNKPSDNKNSPYTIIHYSNSKQNDNHRYHHNNHNKKNNNNNSNNDKNEKNNGNNEATSCKSVICSFHNQFVPTKKSFCGQFSQYILIVVH